MAGDPLRIAAVGSGRSVHVLARSAALAARGHHVRLVTLGEVLPAEGVEVRTRPIPRTLGEAVRAARSFWDDLHSLSPDLLHLHYAGGKLGTMASLAGIRPFVATVMGGDVLPEEHVGGLPRFEGWATRRILAQADLVLAKSDALRAPIAAFGRYRGRVEVVRWGVDPARFRRDPAAAEVLRARLGLAPKDRIVLSPRLVRPLYNVDVLLEAMLAVLARVPEAVLLVTEYNPDDAYRQRLHDRAAALRLGDRVRFISRVEHTEMPALYSLAEVVVSLASADGLPQAMLEAMACETPVVISRLPAYEEIVQGGACAVPVEITPASVAEGVIAVLSDPARRTAVVERALARVREAASLPRDAERVEALFRELVAQPRRRALRPARPLEALSLLLR